MENIIQAITEAEAKAAEIKLSATQRAAEIVADAEQKAAETEKNARVFPILSCVLRKNPL